MNKRLFSLLAVVVLAFSVSANAINVIQSVTPSLSLSISGNTANCSAKVYENGKKINVTMELWNGGKLLATWTGSGTNYAIASGSYSGVQRGRTYTLKAYGTADGRAFTVTPISKKA